MASFDSIFTATAEQTALCAGDAHQDSRQWIALLGDAFADSQRTTGFLPLAEKAVRAHPGDHVILCFAATAALLDERPVQALVFLKRYHKRYVPDATYHLLYALAIGQRNKFHAAQTLLERHRLHLHYIAMGFFPGGEARGRWLRNQLDRILTGRNRLSPRSKWAAPRTRPATASHPASPPPAAAPQAEAPAAPPGLARIDIDIPVMAELDLAPLITAIQHQPETDGGWYRLRERFAHLGLAQGFDELLCLPHLHGIETFWYQVETVRKVLKQFHGRVLLADEVGLGKTIEAGMVLKEYLLRGMVESVLILVPPSLVGQWREELETKFDISYATTHDALARTDPDRFWAQNRLIASLALARRSEHSERLLSRTFDLVIVDEAHHLRDRASQSYKLVDRLKKRFLLLLSATPVQNDLTELYNVLTLLKPGIFKTLKEFRAAYMTTGKPRQPVNPERMRELMRGAMIRNTRAVVALKLPRRHATTVWVEGSHGERRAYEDLAAQARNLAADGTAGHHHLALRHLLALRDLRRQPRPPQCSVSPRTRTTRSGARWERAGRLWVPAARKSLCSSCCGAIRLKRSWSSSITAIPSITWQRCWSAKGSASPASRAASAAPKRTLP
jgi:hypothetical protein